MKIFFQNKKLIITGGSQGIGLAITKYFSNLDCKVISLQRRPLTNKTLKNVDFIKLDLGQTKRIQAQCTKLIKKYKSFDFLVLNASLLFDKSATKITPADIDQVIKTNLISNILLCKYLGPKINKAGGIIYISSTAPRLCSINSGLYSASKSAMECYMKILAKELAPKVRVNIVAPGPTLTALLQKSIKQKNTPSIKNLIANIPLQKLAQPEDIAQAVGFLLSDNAGHITGQVLAVNGGRFM
jgi:3-oxoacyl-[acyl-carrier protein] reductase